MSDLAGAIDDPDCRDIDVAALHQGYLSGLKKRGGRLKISSALRRLDWTGQVWQADVGGHEIEADLVINAAGAWGDHVADMAGVQPVGLVPRRRTIIVFDPTTDPIDPDWPLVFDLAETFYFKPESGGVLASPADETAAPAGDSQPEEEDVAMTADRIQRATTLDVPRIRQRWAGLRTFAPDRAPVIGPDARKPSFFWSVGQGGWGIQTAPAWGRLVADLIRDNRVSEELAAAGVTARAYSPRRFAQAA
jgi:D-arginine dehydrogenase